MSDAVWIALLSGPVSLGLDRLVRWLRNRRKEDAEAGLTVDQRWKNLADKYEERISALEERDRRRGEELVDLRGKLQGALAEVDRYQRYANSFARHVLRLREALANAGAEVPMLPSDIEDALTIVNLPTRGGE